MNQDKFDELIEKAKQESKRDFLNFITGVYGLDTSLYEHIFEIPVIGRYDADELVTTALSTKTEDELFEIINEEINKKEAWKNNNDIAIYMNFDDINDLNQKEKEELYSITKFNAVIVYNYSLLKDLIKRDSKKLTEEELFNKYLKIMKETITHERIHINNAYMDIYLEKVNIKDLNEEQEKDDSESEIEHIENSDTIQYPNIKGLNIAEKNAKTHKNEQLMRENIEELNGAEANLRYDIDLMEISDYEEYWENNNEVLVETITQMISNYENGDSLNQCLRKVIEERNGETIYPGVDDKIVLGTYILFTKELTDWMIFGAYDSIRENKLQKLIKMTCGTDMPLSSNELKKRFENYINTLKEGSLTDDQIEMIKMLGFEIERGITKGEIKEEATSERTLDGISPDVEALMLKLQRDDTNKEK